MILFQEDWMSYPSAIIHTSTKNESFLRLAEIYHRLGVKNNAFMLALHNPELEHIDPHDENISTQTAQDIVEECIENPWYYFREILRIPIPGSPNASPFKADRANIAALWLYFNHILTLIVILRQTGKTTLICGLGSYLLQYGASNTFVNLLTKSEGLKAETLAKLKAILEVTPDKISFVSKGDIMNSDMIRLRALLNTFKGNLSSSSEKNAEKVGRGFTSATNLGDEVAYIDNIATALGAMLMSGNAAREFARENGTPYGTLLATTAGNKDDRDGKAIYNIAVNGCRWNERFLDCVCEDDLNDAIIKNLTSRKLSSKRPTMYVSYSYRQLGYDDAWLQRRLAENISTPENLRRDLFNEWLSGSNKSPIDAKYLELLNEGRIDDARNELFAPHNYMLRWYATKQEIEERTNAGDHFIVGVDTSDAVGRDDVGFIVRSAMDGKVLCVGAFNDTNLITLASFFVVFLIAFENSTMCIERKSSAVTIIDYMILQLVGKGINPFKRLYNTIVQEKERYAQEYEEIMRDRCNDDRVFSKYKKHIGFATSSAGATSRSELYSTTLLAMLKYTAAITHDVALIEQISSLELRNGRVDHASGGNDDLVIAALLSFWMLTSARNVSVYGLPSSIIMKRNDYFVKDKYDSESQAVDDEKIYYLEEEFNKLMESYREERNPTIAHQIECRIRVISRHLKQYNVNISVEGMLDDIKRERRVRRMQHQQQ